MIDPRETQVEIVYDCDDILWPYVKRLAQKLGIDLTLWTEFYAPDNRHWSAELIARANELLMDPQLFRGIQFDKGVGDILKPEELGVKVKINSNSPSDEITELKKTQLIAAVPKLKPEQMQFNKIKINTVTPKPLSQSTLIYVDDNPYHILDSAVPIHIMRAWPWNTSRSARTMLANKRRVRTLPDLETINRFVYYRTKAFLRSGT